MAVLPGPYELFELQDKQSAELTITGYQLGEITIHPTYAGAPAEKVVKAMRVFVAAGTKPMGTPWWDMTSQTLVASLEPWIRGAATKPVKVKLTAYGIAPSKRYGIEVVP